ncbi:transient receptor potential-gamma protein-like protein [Sarcoptes scabiei]|uniref:Transient receptor potential-gamma protein-like protein n=1 Tax=Sarcoptes scabiei TaxID=52283 RepID=A0A131ZTR6_SARSC|nr:transient receptor potential-gamma protein-like protein [Sarcoptes scabiei]
MLASQRIESNIFGIDPMDQTSSNSNSSTDAINSNSTKRGSLPSYIELLILFWVFGLIWSEIKQLWDLGITEYLSDMWNILDFINNSIYVATIALRIIAYCQTQKEISIGQSNLAYHRDKWDDFDPILLSEGLFATANIFSSLKLVYIFSINPYLGPLQISLGRMVIDILKFFSIYLLVLFSFACGMNQLLWFAKFTNSYYADMEKQSCSMQQSNTQNLLNSNATLTLEERFETNTLIIDMLHPNACFTWRRFANLFESTQTLFWATFGLIDLDIFELTGIKSYTRFWGLLMFGVYCIINVAVLLNLLIAMMNHSYQLISEQADTEWKFARSKLWISYFSDGATVPPPFNIIPTPKSILTFLHWFSTLFYQTRKAKNEAIRTTKKKQQKANERDVKYFKVVRSLVRRYVMNEQRIQERQRGVTEDDCNEIKQEISALRYNLLELLGARKKNNIINGGCSLLGKKGRQRERRLIKGFNFDVVKDDAQENVVDDDDDIDNGGATVSKQSKHTKNENNISNHLDNDTRHQSQRSKRSSFHQSNSSLVNILNRNRAANRFYKVAQNYKKIKGARWKQLLEVTTRTKVKPSSQSQMLPRPSILPPLSSRSFRSQNSIDGDNFVDHLNDDRQNFTLDRRPASIRRKMFARRTDTMATSTTSQPIIFESDHHRKQLALIDADDDDDDDDNFNADHNDLFDLKIIDKNLRNTFIDEKWI